MCGRYSLFAPPGDLESRFDATFDAAFEPRYNAAPGQSLPVVTDDESDAIQRFEWGLLPRWAEETDVGHVNARAETVDEKPTFDAAYAGCESGGEDDEGRHESPEAGRCLVLADGFYEWADVGDGRRPYRVAFEDDRPFAMAGLWTRWTPATHQAGLERYADATETGGAAPVETFTVLTTTPNGVVERLHDRMAVILAPNDERDWLDGRDVSMEAIPAEDLRAYPVPTAVNDPSNDRPGLVEDVGPREDDGANA